MSMCFTPRKQWESYWRCYVKQEFHFYQKVMAMTRGDWFPFFSDCSTLTSTLIVSDCICLGGQRSNGQISILGSFGLGYLVTFLFYFFWAFGAFVVHYFVNISFFSLLWLMRASGYFIFFFPQICVSSRVLIVLCHLFSIWFVVNFTRWATHPPSKVSY